MSEMQAKLSRYTVRRWCEDFVDSLGQIKAHQETLKSRLLGPTLRKSLAREYRRRRVRALFLDYDGTLVPFAAKPAEAAPDAELLGILRSL